MSFDKDINSFAKKVDKAALAIFRGTALTLFGNIVKRTPVDTGRLRGNWQAQINTPPLGTTTTDDRSGGKANAGAKREVGIAKIGDSIYFTNNLPYAGVIEDGSSKQAPQGMVKVTVAEFKQIVNKKARENRR